MRSARDRIGDPRRAKARRPRRWTRRAAVVLGVVGLALFATYWFRPDLVLRAEFARQAWQAGVSKRALDAAGHRWSYYEGGQGPVIVLLHGFAGSKENWLPIVGALTRTHRVLIPDLPGWGESTRIAGEDYGIQAQVERVDAFLDAVGAGKAVRLAGHSMGGHIAGVFAATHGERLAALLLVDTAGVHFEPNDFARAVLAGGTPFNVDDVAQWDVLMATLFDRPPWLPPRVKQYLVDQNIASHAFQDQLIRRLSTGDAAFLLEGELPRIAVPTLVLWCANDRVLDVSSMRTIRAQLPQATYVTLAACSHMPTMEQPAAMTAAVRDFLTTLPPPRAD